MPSDPPQTTADDALAAECVTLIRAPNRGRIAAIKHVRAVKHLSLKQAFDWVVALNIEPITRSEMLEKARTLRYQAADLLKQATDIEANANAQP